jgi:hypothetical protein
VTTDLQNAIDKARRIGCAVKVLTGRTYLVTTPQQHAYMVRFETINGLRYGRCNCKAGAAGLLPANGERRSLKNVSAHGIERGAGNQPAPLFSRSWVARSSCAVAAHHISLK